MPQIIVLYHQPTDVQTFEAAYTQHLALLHEKTGIPAEVKPYTLTRFLPTPMGNPPYYLMFSLPFESMEALQATMLSPAMKEVGADAARISTGGAPLILIGN